MYREKTGESEIDLRKVAEFAIRFGFPLPPPVNPIDRLAKLFAEAARQEIRHDTKTGRPYRANHAVQKPSVAGQLVFSWIDIDDPVTTPQNMRKSLVTRREQMVDDGLQLTLDMDHWNSLRPEAEHIALPMDLSLDIEWRKAALDDDEAAA
jgi:hypothetical protein